MNRPIDTLKQAIEKIRASLANKEITDEQSVLLTQDAYRAYRKYRAYRRTITNREAA